MTFSPRTISTRPAPLSHKPWVPDAYMVRAVEHLTTRYSAGLALDPGMSKTSITLEAFSQLQEAGKAKTMLVVAPLRVCRKVWRQEGAKWTNFRHLKFTLLHGDKKDDLLKAGDADIYLINPEGCDWLAKKFFGRPLPFDVVTIDELTRFKNASSERSKALRPRLKMVRYRWGLTGSLAPNGYMDLFGQMLMLDDGAALGRYITHYRDQYFQLGYDGFTYDLMPGAEARIIARIAPYWLQLSAEDYLTLPELVEDIIELELEPPARRTYEKMKRDMIASLPDGIVTAANAAACYSKLAQMANGAVYVGDHKEKVALIHDDKLYALEDLLEELNGQPFKELKGRVPPGGKPLLIAYEFNHDLDRLRERFGTLDPATGKKVLPYLGKGTTAKQESLWIDAWNRNELPILPAHPASAGHGLNLQEGAAAHVAWLGPIWDLELWDQFIRRIRRRGNTAQRVINHIISCRGTIDDLKMEALRDKDVTQGRLLKALNFEIRRDAETQTAGVAAEPRRNESMVAKLSRPGTAAPAHNENNSGQETARVQPKGWGAKAPQQTDIEETAPAQNGQRDRMAQQLQGEGAVVDARSAFSRGVQDKREALQGEVGVEAYSKFDNNPRIDDTHSNGVRVDQDGEKQAVDAPAPASRRRRAPAAEAPGADALPSMAVSFPDTSPALLKAARANLMAAVVRSDPSATVEDLTEACDALWKWVEAA